MEIETEFPQFFTPKTQTRKVKMLKQERGRREINSPPQFSKIQIQSKTLKIIKMKIQSSKERSKFKSKRKKPLITSNYLLFIHFLFLDFGI